MSTDLRPTVGKDLVIFMLFLAAAAYIVVSPMLTGLAWGALLAFLWRPVHLFLSRRRFFSKRKDLCAITSMLLLLFCITLPITYCIGSLAHEFIDSYETLSGDLSSLGPDSLPDLSSILPASIMEYLSPWLADKQRVASALASAARMAASFLRSLSAGLIGWTGAFIFQAFITLMTMYFMIRDGEKAVSFIRSLLPLPEEDRDRFTNQTASIMRSVAYGTILTVAVQATLGAIGWAVAGLSNVFLAASAMFFFGMVPFGTAVVWLPGSIYLIATGHTAAGIGLLLWGACVVSMIDSFIRPLFIGDESIPTLALIVGLTGGLIAWGLLGVFLGPLIIALLRSTLSYYVQSQK